MLKKIIAVVILAMSGSGVAQAQEIDFSVLEKRVEQSNQICCLPLTENDSEGTGFCYVSKDGFLAARIEDKELRDKANKYTGHYPLCRDAWCSFMKEKGNAEYFRVDDSGRILKRENRKFEQDIMGRFPALPALSVKDKGPVFPWPVVEKAKACEIKPDFNLELIGDLCVMVNNGDGTVSAATDNDLQAFLSSLSEEGPSSSYLVFYADADYFVSALGIFPARYWPAVLASKANVDIKACSLGTGVTQETLKHLHVRIK